GSCGVHFAQFGEGAPDPFQFRTGDGRFFGHGRSQVRQGFIGSDLMPLVFNLSELHLIAGNLQVEGAFALGELVQLGE
ncbi:hypothetical protein ABTG06_19390, partial [Acinetobacter baumannii]